MTLQAAPEISVCLPVYNGEAFIGQAIDSILSQSFENFELIITDDISKDRTPEILQAYKAKDSRVKVFFNEVNNGALANYNYNLSLAKGKYIKIFAADDVMMDGHLEQMHEAFERNPSVSLVACAKQIIDSDGALLSVSSTFPKTGLYPGKDVRKNCLKNELSSHIINLIGEPACTLLRAIDVKGGFDAGYFHITDLDMWTRALAKGDLYYFSEPLCKYRQHKDSTTSNNFKSLYYALDFLRILDKNLELCIELYGSREQAYLSVAEHLGRFLDILVKEEKTNVATISENLRDWADPVKIQSGMKFVPDQRPETLTNQEYFRQLALFSLLKTGDTASRLDSTYDELNKQLQACRQELDAIKSSTLWKSTKFARAIGRFIKK